VTWVAFFRRAADTAGVPAVNNAQSLLDPLVAVAALGLLMLICRWVFSTGHRESRGARRLDRVLSARDYGLLVAVATVRTRDDAEMLRDVLKSAGVRAGISDDSGELQVLVFSKDLARARQLVSAS
jgi:hypothetical protein